MVKYGKRTLLRAHERRMKNRARRVVMLWFRPRADGRSIHAL
jgi:hypothetical protein